MNIPRPALYVLAGVLALVLAVVIVLSWRSGGDEPTVPPATNAPASTVAPSDGGGGEPSDGGGDDDDLLQDGQDYSGPDTGLKDGSETDRKASAEVAEKAAGVWVDHDLSSEEWSKALKPYVSPESWKALNLPAPQRVSPTEVTGEVTDGPDSVSTETADYLIPTDAGDLSITLVKQGDDWKVSYIDKEL